MERDSDYEDAPLEIEGRPRAAEVLRLVREQPGMTIPEVAEHFGTEMVYLYALLPELEEKGQVAKRGRHWYPDGFGTPSSHGQFPLSPPRRAPIPERVRNEVWRRDEGRCVQCGSQERLEFDHLIPWSRGGSDTARNLQLLCEACNRRKSDHI
jgi:hypothetical protein